jgi:benzodiazapine receptor
VKPREIGVASLFILACLAAGAIGGLATYPAIPEWYAGLNKPDFSPPNWVFGPVWTILYVMMGVAAYLAYSEGKKAKRKDMNGALAVFGIQLCLNVLWSLLFFGLRSPLYGLACIAALWLAIAAAMARFYAISRPAGLLLAPYLAWVSFAAVLNFQVWALN